jgi:hypothetical protein
MPRNGSGVYSPTVTGGSYPAVGGTLIDATKHNTQMEDIADALTDSLTKDGQTTPTANLPMGGYKLTGMGSGSAAGDSASLGQVQAAAYQWCGTAGGTANALTLTPSPPITAYAAGQVFRFKSGASANTGAATVAISGLAAIAIQRNGAALSGGEIDASQWYEIVLSDTSTAQLKKIGYPAGFSFNGSGIGLSTSQALTAANKNKWFAILSGSLTITLPPFASLAPGSTYSFVAGSAFTLAGNGAENIQTAVGAANTLSVAAGEYLTVVNDWQQWWVISRSAEPVTASSAIQTFTSNGTWTKPSGGTYAEIILIGGGGGGGSGRKSIDVGGPATSGGAGGGGGGYTAVTVPLSALGATEAVVIGAGGTGGAAVSTSSTDGNAGNAGGNTTFAGYKAGGGGGGGGGNALGNSTAGTAGTGTYSGGAGGAGVAGAAGAAGSSGSFAGAGGGGGGGVSSGPALYAGGNGGTAGSSILSSVISGGTGGNTTTTAATAGGSGASRNIGGGGAGGGGTSSTAGTRQGANGGAYGGGGGGGGCGVNGTYDSGAGGNGADGFAMIIVR